MENYEVKGIMKTYLNGLCNACLWYVRTRCTNEMCQAGKGGDTCVIYYIYGHTIIKMFTEERRRQDVRDTLVCANDITNWSEEKGTQAGMKMNVRKKY